MIDANLIVCPYCKVVFEKKNWNQVYCSPDHHKLAKGMKIEDRTVNCLWCHAPFVTTRSCQRYCSRSHRLEARSLTRGTSDDNYKLQRRLETQVYRYMRANCPKALADIEQKIKIAAELDERNVAFFDA